MDRKESLLKIVGEENEVFIPLVDEIVFIEGQLIKLKKLPFININPKNTMQQKSTPAAKLYKEFLQQYNNCIRTIAKATGQDESDEESPLRKWVRDHVNN